MTFSDESQAKLSLPLWLVLLDNVPTMGLIFLGTLILAPISLVFAGAYLVYSIFSIVWVWAKICPACHYYGTCACPCGYGTISARFFKPSTGNQNFAAVFKRHIVVVFPNWFVPLFAGIFLLVFHFSGQLLLYFILFTVTGFIIIPGISKWVGCRNCTNKANCPWMK